MSLTSLLYRLNHASLWRRSVRVWGRRLRASSLDRLLCLWLHRVGLMGRAERQVLRRRVSTGMQVVDIGANLGLYSLLLAQLAGPEGRVFAFEPEPSLFRVLRHNCRRSGLTNLRLFNQALGDRAGRVGFYRSVFNSGDNRLGGLGWKGEGVEVEMVRLDDALPVRRIDFIKMDVQGYEMRVLRGMEEVMRASPGLEIYFEFWPAGLRAAGTDPEEVFAHLHDRGFHVYDVEGETLEPVAGFDRLRDRLAGSRFMNLLASRDGERRAGRR
jgi:FkbM family methyltransferase